MCMSHEPTGVTCCIQMYLQKSAGTKIAASTQSVGLGERWGAGVETQKMYGERLWDWVEYHLMSPTPRC